MLYLTSCDLLTTRDPEKPSAPRDDFITPTQPSILFQNLKNSFRQKVVENYLQCLADEAFSDDEFRYIPSAGISQSEIFIDWDVNAERQYFNTLLSRVEQQSEIILELNNEEKTISSDSARYQFEYVLKAVYVGASEVTYKGNSLFTVKTDRRSNWVITKWEDIKVDDYPSWSELKGSNY
ncbi:MAG: hypothetical protein JW995_07450 [Melioribacteraceae bacterium]|nr:hypothetical protein [Melioribacteraceae bacterium]